MDVGKEKGCSCVAFVDPTRGFPRRGIGINLVAGMTSNLVWGELCHLV